LSRIFADFVEPAPVCLGIAGMLTPTLRGPDRSRRIAARVDDMDENDATTEGRGKGDAISTTLPVISEKSMGTRMVFMLLCAEYPLRGRLRPACCRNGGESDELASRAVEAGRADDVIALERPKERGGVGSG